MGCYCIDLVNLKHELNSFLFLRVHRTWCQQCRRFKF